ncbi:MULTISPECIES: hypothetical protein [unclassified Pseudomonas]|uniref:hypothetical protein n=1 Tax=unclassified Pseudomonas TaxID=196821 RepID=UPI00147381E6|nr:MULTISPECIES: hypothetical protein [unclassified Pseudomonas]NMX93433.1 hypothetical protein [Pseudomonas sp. WS 5086]NMY48255.1 hypothetical protein [Pseudomonas sp. WS 5027]
MIYELLNRKASKNLYGAGCILAQDRNSKEKSSHPPHMNREAGRRNRKGIDHRLIRTASMPKQTDGFEDAGEGCGGLGIMP